MSLNIKNAEVERLYKQRRDLIGPAPAPGQLLETDFVLPENVLA